MLYIKHNKWYIRVYKNEDSLWNAYVTNKNARGKMSTSHAVFIFNRESRNNALTFCKEYIDKNLI